MEEVAWHRLCLAAGSQPIRPMSQKQVSKSATWVAFLVLVCSGWGCGTPGSSLTLSGTLGKFAATLSLKQSAAAVEGVFRYAEAKTSASAIALRGSLDGSQLHLAEYADGGEEPTGTFLGRWNGEVYTGRWHAPTGDKTVPFEFALDQRAANESTWGTFWRKLNGGWSKPQIEYVMTHFPEGQLLAAGIKATMNGRTYVIITPFEDGDDGEVDVGWYFLDTVADFDNDGYVDALITYYDTGGGNCCPPDYFFCTYDVVRDTFVMTEHLVYSWARPILEKADGKTLVKLTFEDQDENGDAVARVDRWYALDNHQSRIAKEVVTKKTAAFIEITSAQAEAIEDWDYDALTLKIDLNGDGRMDTISTDYDLKWHQLQWSVTFAGEAEACAFGEGKRVGVLASTHHGVHDLVNHVDELYIWDGTQYVWEGGEE